MSLILWRQKTHVLGKTSVLLKMNVEELHQVLQQSFSPDASVRKPAEKNIRNLKHIPGAVPALLRVASEHQVGLLRVQSRCCV